MVVLDAYLIGMTRFPDKADPPLIVDSDTILTVSVPGEFLEVVAWRRTQVVNRNCGVKHEELAIGTLLNG